MSYLDIEKELQDYIIDNDYLVSENGFSDFESGMDYSASWMSEYDNESDGWLVPSILRRAYDSLEQTVNKPFYLSRLGNSCEFGKERADEERGKFPVHWTDDDITKWHAMLLCDSCAPNELFQLGVINSCIDVFNGKKLLDEARLNYVGTSSGIVQCYDMDDLLAYDRLTRCRLFDSMYSDPLKYFGGYITLGDCNDEGVNRSLNIAFLKRERWLEKQGFRRSGMYGSEHFVDLIHELNERYHGMPDVDGKQRVFLDCSHNLLRLSLSGFHNKKASVSEEIDRAAERVLAVPSYSKISEKLAVMGVAHYYDQLNNRIEVLPADTVRQLPDLRERDSYDASSVARMLSGWGDRQHCGVARDHARVFVYAGGSGLSNEDIVSKNRAGGNIFDDFMRQTRALLSMDEVQDSRAVLYASSVAIKFYPKDDFSTLNSYLSRHARDENELADFIKKKISEQPGVRQERNKNTVRMEIER